MYIGHDRMCVCLCVSVPRRIPTLLHGPGCNLRNGRGCPLVVHYWADMQSVHWFRCYGNVVPNAKCERVLVLALCLVIIIITVIVKNVSREACCLRIFTALSKTARTTMACDQTQQSSDIQNCCSSVASHMNFDYESVTFWVDNISKLFQTIMPGHKAPKNVVTCAIYCMQLLHAIYVTTSKIIVQLF